MKIIDWFEHVSTPKKALALIGLLVAVVIVTEILGLLLLLNQVSRYRNFWLREQQKTGEVVYVAIGDSAAQGVGATSPYRGYVGLIAKKLEQATGKKVKIINVSVTGAKVADALEKQLPQLAELQPDFITVEVGANNVKTYDEVQFKKDFTQLVQRLPSGSYIADVPDFGWGKHLSKQRRAAEVAREIIATRPDIKLVQLDAYMQKNFNHLLDYAPDFFHPDNSGYRVWADAFWQTIEPDIL